MSTDALDISRPHKRNTRKSSGTLLLTRKKSPSFTLPMPFRIRQASPDDAAALNMVCLKTGSSGADATSQFLSDPDALGAFVPASFKAPFVAFLCTDALCRPILRNTVPKIRPGKLGLCALALCPIDEVTLMRFLVCKR